MGRPAYDDADAIHGLKSIIKSLGLFDDGNLDLFLGDFQTEFGSSAGASIPTCP